MSKAESVKLIRVLHKSVQSDGYSGGTQFLRSINLDSGTVSQQSTRNFGMLESLKWFSKSFPNAALSVYY